MEKFHVVAIPDDLHKRLQRLKVDGGEYLKDMVKLAITRECERREKTAEKKKK